MTKVTDKMVQDAMENVNHCIPWWRMRGAIEAALAARDPANAGELVRRLRGKMMHEFGIDGLGNEAADAIEELVVALKPFAGLHVDEGDYPDTDVSTYEGNVVHAASTRRARALLTRMGVKL